MADLTESKKASTGETWTENVAENATGDIADKVAEDLGLSANYQEHQLGRLETIRKQPKLVGWCLFAIYACLLVSFENQASGNVLSIPRFRQDFGHYYDGSYVLYTGWQSAFYGGPLAATIISVMAASAISDRFGRKYLMIGAILCSFAAIALEFVAVTNQVFFGAKIINGFSTGVIWAIGMAYVGELTPLPLRGILTCLTALMFTIGPLVAAIIINFTGNYENRWAYRAVFCAQFGFAGICAIFMWFMPESPVWLVSVDRLEDASRSLRRLGYTDLDAAKKISQTKLALELARRETEGATYVECFRKSNIRRTIISVMPMAMQSLTGVYFVASYGTYYIQLAGYSTEASFSLQIVQQCLALAGNVSSWFLIDKIGRRPLTVWGLASMTVINMVFAGLGSDTSSTGAIKASVGLIVLYNYFYNVSIGATAFTIVTEVPTSRLRAKTISMGIALQYIIYTIWAFVLPLIFNPDQANLGGKTAFIFGGFSVLSTIYAWFFQMETAGRSYEELDELFQKGVSVREFGTYVTDVQKRAQEVGTSQDAKSMDS